MPDTSSVHVRLPDHLRQALQRAAEENDRSVNRQAERYLREALVRDGRLARRDERRED
jgi:hypothetical protein